MAQDADMADIKVEASTPAAEASAAAAAPSTSAAESPASAPTVEAPAPVAAMPTPTAEAAESAADTPTVAEAPAPVAAPLSAEPAEGEGKAAAAAGAPDTSSVTREPDIACSPVAEPARPPDKKAVQEDSTCRAPIEDSKSSTSGLDTKQDVSDSRSGGSKTTIWDRSQGFASQPCLSWITNPYVWWRHPLLRLFIACLILGLDMYLFGEDPVNDSHVECALPGVGNIMALFLRGVVNQHQSSAFSVLVRILLIILAILSGMFIGWKFLHHLILRDCMKLEMFRDCNGTWLPMGVCVAGCLYIASMLHNVIVTAEEDQLSSATGMEMRVFAKLCQSCSVTADLGAILLILDAVLQDLNHYPRFAHCLKQIWMNSCNGFVRVVAVWVLAVVSVVSFAYGIWSTGKEAGDFRWDERGVGGLTEVARALLVSGVMFCDVFTVSQDWEFPCFTQPIDVKIAGTFSTELNCRCVTDIAKRMPSPPACCRRWLPDSSFFNLHITGPWLTYGPLLVVIALDMFCMRTQLFYEPSIYGQYVDPVTQRIWTIIDEEYLLEAYEDGVLKVSDMITYEARRNTTTGAPLDNTTAATDIELNSRYLGSALKYGAAVPGFVSILLFFMIVWIGNHQRLYASRVARLGETIGNNCRAAVEALNDTTEAAMDAIHSTIRNSPRQQQNTSKTDSAEPVSIFVRPQAGGTPDTPKEASGSRVHPEP